jgi:hypothetical protein
MGLKRGWEATGRLAGALICPKLADPLNHPIQSSPFDEAAIRSFFFHGPDAG